MRVYRSLLRAPHAVRLLGGTLLGRLPNGMGVLAITLFTRDEGGSWALAGLLAAVHGLAAAFGQPVLGRLMDRLGQPRVLVAAASLAGLGFVAFAWTGIGAVPAALAAVAVAGLFTPPLEPGLRALWPEVLKEPDQVQAAYAMDAAAQELLFTFGPVLVIVSGLVSDTAPLYACALLGLAGTLIVALSGPSRAWRGSPSTGDWAGALRSPGLVVIGISLGFIGLSLGVFNVGMVAYAEGIGSESASGWLMAANALGALTGGLVYGARTWPGRPARRIPPMLAALTAGYALLLLTPGLPLMLVLAYVSGVFLAPILACVFGLVPDLAPEGTVTEAFAWIVAFMTVGVSAGSALAGKIQDEAGTVAALSGSALGGLAAVLVCVAGGWLLTVRSPVGPRLP
ncbi:putative MFS family arabinose efflux permease [Actinocorallia herbida]|uniref:Putative MFS family arabinose efflux permease n=1 Tax=Actinocorallia herbida TaxID=58109 RepID=A0A3N1D6U9_9ACTN|nr:MFS transporter [Actinocorallia herbida]ROO89252.1 putative MFS family arabinose efflux permease [Actinocorallia herbida]